MEQGIYIIKQPTVGEAKGNWTKMFIHELTTDFKLTAEVAVSFIKTDLMLCFFFFLICSPAAGEPADDEYHLQDHSDLYILDLGKYTLQSNFYLLLSKVHREGTSNYTEKVLQNV